MVKERTLLTPLEYFYKWETQTPDNIWLRQPKGNQWIEYTFREAGQIIRKMAAALLAMDFPRQSNIGIISENCCHNELADLAIQMAGHVPAPFYHSMSFYEFNGTAKKSNLKAIFAGKLGDWEKLKPALSEEVKIIAYPQYENAALIDNAHHQWDDLIQAQEALQESPIPKLEDLWTIIFTSGTTNVPKGVMHTQSNVAIYMQAEQEHNVYGFRELDQPHLFSFLPFNHIADRMYSECMSLMLGCRLSFAESLATFAQNIAEVQPDWFGAVPRIWMKFYLGVTAQIPAAQLNAILDDPVKGPVVAQQLKNKLGISKIKYPLTGAALTPVNLKEWYKKLGIQLREMYGMTETMGGLTVSPIDGDEVGTVGKPIPGAAVRIHPETGEVIMKAPWLMKGYYNEPEKTAEILKDGWLYSGDKGVLTEGGHLKIIGRVKDAFKTAKGKYVVPTIIEEQFSQHPFIEQICVTGLGYPQPIALINLSEKGKNTDAQTIAESLADDMARVNSNLAKYERLVKIVITKDEWSAENQLLTSTLKIRRGKINDIYSDKMDSWYGQADIVVWEVS
jgi:long-subunit acyl-CoA synthetase (AMP-forming)